ncbi:50S ribosomal protein L18 [Aliifodinibius sp. 1BSP15-2V2]|uniref:Large ribosomal subunit protein uL18 n=2 Tax=Fodinibius salsisoli TaxID=2820877 RepID=A0ABT3PTP7_9BACT|nr:50S ribosomal protein L18 [Fodinibius salsisoli]MCW9709236.1 50S ribosomal protein L18 [Fodinibius salsisoli]
MDKTIEKRLRRDKIRRRIRATVRGTAERPRLGVYKSNKHVYAQLIDDLMGQTLASASTQSNELSDEVEGKTKQEAAEAVGKHLAQLADEKGINKAVFDRSGYKYHGVIKALADGAREGGLDF